MAMTTKKIAIAGECVELVSDIDLDAAFERHERFSVFMPSFSIIPDSEACHSRLVHSSIENISYTVTNGSHATLCAPANRIDAEVLAYAAYPLTEFRRQQRGAVTAHSAAVAYDESAALILGKEGAGKSTVAIHSCRDFGGKLIGNDLTIVESPDNGGIHVSHGTKVLHLRRESVRRGLADLLKMFPSETDDAWLQKIALSPDMLGIQTRDHPVDVKISALVHVDEAQEKLFVRDESKNLVSRLTIYENFSRYIRGSCVPGLDKDKQFMYCLPSLDNSSMFEKRTKLIERVLRQPLLYVSGRSKEIAQFIQQEITHA
jgi:hypothetical protein